MPRGPRNLRIAFGSTTLTHYGGVYLFHRFLTRIGFKRALGQDIQLAQRNNRYSVGEMLLGLLYPMVLGLERIETTQLLHQNGVFQYLTGLPKLSGCYELAAVPAARRPESASKAARFA